jgi:hypothetical protein
MATLQEQGVPIQSGLRGSYSSDTPRGTYGAKARPQVRSAQSASPSSQARRTRRNSRTNRPINPGNYTPSRMADKSVSGVGLLEAEFFGALILLVVLMFTGTASYAEQIMSLMKRGSLVCMLFFILALIAGIGDGMAKISKGFGALIIIGILVTTPASGAITDVDNLIKNDWTGTSEHGDDVGSADSGTSASSPSGTLGLAEGALNRLNQIISFGKGIL